MLLYFGLLLLLFVCIFFVECILPIFITKKLFSLEFPKKMYIAILICLSLFSLFLGSLFSLFSIGEIGFSGIVILFLLFSFILLIPVSRFLKNRFNTSWGKYIAFMFTSLLMIGIISTGVSSVIRSFYQPFQIRGQSMSPSYYDKEYLIIQKTVNIERGDVVVFETGDEYKRFFLNRVIATPGDEVKIMGGKVYLKKKGEVNFGELKESYLNSENQENTYIGATQAAKIYTLEDNDYFTLGDNRLHSTDSRECFGDCSKRDSFVGKENIIGKVVLDLGYFNVKKFEFTHPELGINTEPKYFDIP